MKKTDPTESLLDGITAYMKSIKALQEATKLLFDMDCVRQRFSDDEDAYARFRKLTEESKKHFDVAHEHVCVGLDNATYAMVSGIINRIISEEERTKPSNN
jgi:hypothetical protein